MISKPKLYAKKKKNHLCEKANHRYIHLLKSKFAKISHGPKTNSLPKSIKIFTAGGFSYIFFCALIVFFCTRHWLPKMFSKYIVLT